MYTEETVLTYGRYTGKMIKDVPVDYLINVFKTGGDEHAALKEYMEANADKYPGLTLIGWFKSKRNVMVDFKCIKRTFPTKKTAMDSIANPKSKQKGKRPIRAYECPVCSGWHLTSKPDPRFNTSTEETHE